MADEGADAWFEKPVSYFFEGSNHKADDYEKVTDILDVWFDSGSTHAFVLEARGMPTPADLYLEGSDQHRGWFQSSLLESCGTRGRAPYKQVLTHGMTLTDKGLENVEVARQRRRARDASSSRTAPTFCASGWRRPTTGTITRIGDEILKSNVEAYSKLRNTFRYLLGNLAGFDEAERVAVADMPELERVILHKLAELDELVRKAYDDYDFKRIFHALSNFMNIDLSAFYFDIRKDTLYCDAPSSMRRRACRTVLHELFMSLTAWFAPILCFTAEEVWLTRFPSEDGTVHTRLFPAIPADWRDEALAEKWRKVRELAPHRHRRAGSRAPREAHRREPRSRAGRLRLERRIESRHDGRRSRRNLDHQRRDADRRRRSGGRLPSRRRAGRRGRPETGARAEMRALVENPARSRLGSRLSRPDAPRRGGGHRIRRPQTSRRTGVILMARSLSIAGQPVWGPFSTLGAGVAVLGFVLDRLHKWWSLDILDMPGRGKITLTPYFDVVMAWNKGVSYGLFQAETTLGRIGLVFFALAIVTGLGLWLATAANRPLAVAIGLVIGGALGNVLDRLIYGAVADFFSFHAFGFYWYIFNVADIWIVMGVGLILLESVFPGVFGQARNEGRAGDDTQA